MATIDKEKELLRKQILDAAMVYSKELAGKVFMYVYGREYFEVSFMTDRFRHLTGVISKSLSAQDFYDKCISRELTTEQFGFSYNHKYINAKKKLSCLSRLPILTTDYVCILKNQATTSITYKLSVTNLEFTLGLTENVDFEGNKINDLYLPRTLRVKDHSIEESDGGEVVDFIFVRDASTDIYRKVLLADQRKTLPEEISQMIDKEDILNQLKNMKTLPN